MSLQITLTGQLAAEADGTRADATDLPGRQAPVVFAYLVTERDRPVTAGELAEAVWNGALPPTWRPALRGVVSKVRGFLDRLGLPAADALTSSSGCYRLVLPGDTAVDVELAEDEAGGPGGRWPPGGCVRPWPRPSGPGRSPGGHCCPATRAPGSRTGVPRSIRCWSGAWSCWSTSIWRPGRPARPPVRPAGRARAVP